MGVCVFAEFIEVSKEYIPGDPKKGIPLFGILRGALVLTKITRRTTGARGCYFLTSFESFLSKKYVSSNKYQATSIK